MDQRGNPQLHGLADDRTAHIAAGPNADIRVKLLNDSLGFRCGGKEMDGCFDILFQIGPARLSLKAGYGNTLKIKACLRDKLFLHPALCSHVQDRRVGLPLTDGAGNGQRGINVSGGSAAGKEDSHTETPFSSV